MELARPRARRTNERRAADAELPRSRPDHAALSRLMLAGVMAVMLGLSASARAQFSGGTLSQKPEEIKRLDVTEKLGATLPMDLVFTDAQGQSVKLGDYFPLGADGQRHGKPTVLVLAYYRCPVVCSVVISKLTDSFNEIPYTVGKDFNVLVFSINPEEQPSEAKAFKQAQLESYNRGKETGVAPGWQFHTSPAEASKALADAMGWEYSRLPNGEYGHPIGYMLITPDGRIARYMYGYAGKEQAQQVRLAILEASEGKISKTLADRVIGFCYMYDAASGGYALKAFRVMQLGGAATLIAVAALVLGLRLSEVLKRRRRAATLEGDLLISNDRTARGEHRPAVAGR